MLNKIVRVSVLYDTYGELLTGKQRKWFEMYYLEDFSLAEIAKECNVTRQAVHETIIRAEQKLEDFEEKLRFLARLTDKRERLLEVKKHLMNEDKKSFADSVLKARILLQDILDGMEV